MWRKLFSLVYDRFGDCSKVRLVKVKAHTSAASCAGDPEMIWLRGGNAIADTGAKRGAALHPGDDSCIALVAATSGVVAELARYGGRAAEARWMRHKLALKEARDNRASAEGEP